MVTKLYFRLCSLFANEFDNIINIFTRIVIRHLNFQISNHRLILFSRVKMSAKDATTAPEKKKKESILDLTR